jgi:uncharacterized protein (TIGR03086 family)
MHVTDLHRRSVEGFMARVDAIGAEAWAGPTPCPDWDVRALVNHVVNEDLWAVPLMEGATIEEVGNRFDGDLLGDNPAAATRAACETSTMATASGIVAGRIVHLSFGDTPAEEYVRQLLADHLVHAWDLAAAIGADRTLDPALVSACAEWYADREDLYRQAGAVGAKVTVPDGAGEQDRLLGAFGRDPAWKP